MNKEIIFSENQRFNQWWIWLILGCINLYFFLRLILNFVSENKTFKLALIVATSIILIITLLFLSLRLETRIKNDGIYIRFYPFHLKYKHFPWDSLTQCYLRKYSPISEFGGWGLRYGFSGSGKAYNVSGNYGLQLVFNDNKKLLIGTLKADELKTTLQNIGQIKNSPNIS